MRQTLRLVGIADILGVDPPAHVRRARGWCLPGPARRNRVLDQTDRPRATSRSKSGRWGAHPLGCADELGEDSVRMATVEASAYADFIRPDGKEKVTGAGRYTADLTLTGTAYAAFRYADHAHARIHRLDTERARRFPGVVAVITQDDVPDVRFGGFVQDRTLFAKDVVRF